jgi:hypothetical protein
MTVKLDSGRLSPTLIAICPSLLVQQARKSCAAQFTGNVASD